MSNDEVIVGEIRGALDRDPGIPHPAEVAVCAQEGTVKLRGTVGGIPQRRAAVRIAKSVPGVCGVEDELAIDPRDHWQDAEIRGAALQSLMSNPGIPDERIEVNVADGWLTLKGDVKHQADSNAAFESVRRLDGVGGVTNEITVITAGIDG
jgi:osmotically-inducible protein OsmY